jgi:hypothetical protein
MRMAELTAILGRHRPATQASSRPCARCRQHRGRGHKYCAACRQEARREYMADYHQKHYRRLAPEQLSAAKRGIVNRRWRPDV